VPYLSQTPALLTNVLLRQTDVLFAV